MIRRPPSLWPRRLRRALGPLLGSATVASVLLAASLGPGAQPKAVAGPRRSDGRVAAPPAIAKVFHAEGGPVSATVTVSGVPRCRVDLLGAGGTVLATAVVAGDTVTLHALAGAGAPVSLVLHPSRLAGVSWQVDLTGAR